MRNANQLFNKFNQSVHGQEQATAAPDVQDEMGDLKEDMEKLKKEFRKIGHQNSAGAPVNVRQRNRMDQEVVLKMDYFSE